MHVDPFVSMAVYFFVAVSIMATAVKQSPDADTHKLAAFVAMTWPVWVIVIVMFSPVIIGYFIGLRLRKKDR